VGVARQRNVAQASPLRIIVRVLKSRIVYSTSSVSLAAEQSIKTAKHRAAYEAAVMHERASPLQKRPERVAEGWPEFLGQGTAILQGAVRYLPM